MDSLLKADGSHATSSADVTDNIISEKFQQLNFEENETSAVAGVDPVDEGMLHYFFLAGL